MTLFFTKNRPKQRFTTNDSQFRQPFQQNQSYAQHKSQNHQYNISNASSRYQNQNPRPSQYTQTQNSHLKQQKIPCDRNGIQLRYKICESICHFQQQCPEVKSSYTYLTQEVILFQAGYNHPSKMKI